MCLLGSGVMVGPFKFRLLQAYIDEDWWPSLLEKFVDESEAGADY